ncbi:MAG: YwaF family protein [Oscillospiraceae bacterium]|nr:YwaF family protein [Oscillospiraceae bacterium]
MFNSQHISYMLISGILTAALLALARMHIHDEKNKNRILLFSAVLTVMLHYSNLWVDYFATGGTATVENNHILPVYPCNVVMWMLLVSALIKNKQRLLFRILSEFCFYVGTLCGIIGIVLNFNFDNNPTLTDYYVLKGLLSHSTMLFGCLYMLFGRYIKFRVFNVVSICSGLGVFIACGQAVNTLYERCGMTAPDGMWLKGNEYIGICPIYLGFLAAIILFIPLHLREMRLPVEERWYTKLFRRNRNEKLIY